MWSLLRRNRDIRLVFSAQIVSYLGDWFTFVALAGLIEDLTGSKFLVSLVLVSFSLPSFLASPMAGAVADRFDRRRILVIVSLAQAVAALGLVLVGDGREWIAFVAQSMVSALAAFVRPASEAAIPNLVDNDADLQKANSLFGSSWGVMLAVGAALGGLFADVFGRTAAFVTDALTFVVAAGLMAMVRRPMQSHDVTTKTRSRVRPLSDMKEAVTLARNDKVILSLLASKTTFAIGSGLVSQVPVLASQAFNAGDGGRGLLIGFRGVGAGLGPLLVMKFVKRDLSRVILVCGLAGTGFALSYLGAALSPTLPLACVFIGLAHLGGGAQWTLSTYGLQMEAPDHLRGRVMAGDFALITLTLSITSLLAGIVSDALGVRQAIAIFAIAAAIASSIYLVLTRSVRRELASRSE